MESGIYKIESISHPERIYIGSAVNINKRGRIHLSRLRKNKHHSIKLQHHYNKYGEDDLIFSIILGCEKEDLIRHEQFFIDSYNPWFNVCQTAGGRLGTTHSTETKEKIRIAHLGKVASPETKLKLSIAHIGKIQSEETKAKKRVANSGENHHMYGKTPSEETKEKLRVANIGKTYSTETKAKHREASLGEKNPMYGKTHSEEAKAKIGVASIEAWKLRKHNKQLV